MVKDYFLSFCENHNCLGFLKFVFLKFINNSLFIKEQLYLFLFFSEFFFLLFQSNTSKLNLKNVPYGNHIIASHPMHLFKLKV